MSARPSSQSQAVRGPSSSRREWISRILKWLIILFLCFDAAIKILFLPDMPEAAEGIGWDAKMAPILGIILLFATALFAVRRTSLVGAILLTGYLGGAVATHMRVDNPLLTHTLFGVYLGVLIWGSLLLADPRLLSYLRAAIGSKEPEAKVEISAVSGR